MNNQKSGFFSVAKHFFIGKAKNPLDHSIFHNLSLIAFLAWVGLGSDGLSSSCYGPEEAFLALGNHQHLILFVAMATAITVFLVSSSYSQIIELFPSGGGGYLVASKLLSPGAGMVSGCALLIDYVLTITLSVASGTDAVFSFLPASWMKYKLGFAVLGLLILTILNLRGVKESVISLIPIFLLFVITHLIAIIYIFSTHIPDLGAVFKTTGTELTNTHIELGWLGMFFLIMKAYSMGAGTFTGIEAVSNGINILREPRVQTGKRTMHYMAWSLSITVVGLMMGYLLFGVQPTAGKTLNAVLFGSLTQNWGNMGIVFVLVTLLSEAVLLLVAAQTGFIDGPRVLANMALDRWFPTRFASLSDRLVTQNGILLMGGAALILMVSAKGSVKFMVVLYSINVFVTFCMSQTGMVIHWWKNRVQGWKQKLFINGSGLVLCCFILLSVVILKFFEGGWITLLITGLLVAVSVCIKKHYNDTYKQLQRLDHEIKIEKFLLEKGKSPKPCEFDSHSKTAVLLVNGFNGLGIHALLTILRLFGKEFRNFVFVQVGIIDAGTFKGAKEIDHLRHQIDTQIGHYVHYMNSQGFYAKGFSFVGLDIVEEMDKQTNSILKHYPSVVFFGGQLVFPSESRMSRLLHNYTVFALQRMFYLKGIPFVVLPVRLSRKKIPNSL
jgi:amino acid transporter